MLYPENCLERLGFSEVRQLIHKHCLSPMGQQMVDKMQVMTKYDQINKFLRQTNEFKSILENQEPLQISTFFDIKSLADKIKVEGTYLVEEELHQMYASLQTVFSVLRFFEERKEVYPNLEALLEHLPVEKNILKRIETVLDPKGKIKPNASATLQTIIGDISKAEQDVRKRMDSIFKQAVGNNWVADGSLTIRDGRMCIPILAENKRKLKGFIHDESASGQTVYMEPEEVFTLNNKLRDLEFDKRREIIKILIALTTDLRPYTPLLLSYHGFLTKLDFVRAKALFAIEVEADMPVLIKEAQTKLINARHPLLYLSFKADKKTVVPLNIHITPELRIVLVSGPNAGGKSVCMKTVGLLQLMVQSGLLIPVHESSEVGIFENIFADIGDDQSIESDLSTYSAHLTKMRYFVAHASPKTLVLIDEFGTGTDPQFGGPMAEAVLEVLNNRKVRGVITTHYSNLKLFAGNTPGLENASMLFDNDKMKPLYVLELGKPGSSYAFEIAQNIGLQKEVLELARAKTGTNQNRIDSLLVDLEREKKQIYDTKLHLSTQQNKVKNLVAENEKLKLFLDENKKVLIKEAKLEAQAIIKNANKLVENTIAEIKENQADKTVTKQLRQNLQKVLVQNQVKEEKKPEVAVPLNTPIEVGDWVQLNNSETTGQVLEINRDNLVVALGDLRSVLKKNRVYKISNKQAKKAIQNNSYTGSISEAIGNFTAELDLRGMRGDNALHEVEKYLDKSIMLGFPFIKLIHGKGDGILRKLIREYLKKYSQVNRVEDEHADRGGDGITYVYFN
ncbi:DNA mismatch repair protein MutS2 [Pedobacter steynii]|uniref:Endonuclease MutS2 n=1 Tax=Pedobacter steynii TaxID=430522 RepID=A0A1G9P2K9_9SPHI|nr:endonuclease MutS2 [Pedobacter steynii]NQX39115.1 endonuclease MutS2 [Pedobacter steynii]SDL92773.1 DNA mismatch repair protein MutS2 [Pedobacter steynii]